jgi:hypothetical protein
MTVLAKANSNLTDRPKIGVPHVESKKLVADAGESSGTQRKRNVLLWKPLPSNG